MKAGFRGTFVVSWAQTEVDGVAAAPVEALRVGASWAWSGQATRVDGPADILPLGNASGTEELRQRAARSVRRLVGMAIDPGPEETAALSGPLRDRAFVVTDGMSSYTGTQIPTGAGRPPLLMFLGEMPPAGVELWVVREIAEAPPVHQIGDVPPGVICFAAGTRIDTPEGPVPVETLAPGDRIQTKDDGVQEILWVGQRRMSGARLYAMPQLRPIRIRSGALGAERPEGDLIVSPQHRVLVRGRAAEVLFQTPEVLVAAGDLLNDRTILVDHTLSEVTYVHLMLERHQIVWANGVETESFHPANTSLDTVPGDQRDALIEVFPMLAHDPYCYGDFARRNLDASEAAILQYEGALSH
ncbi:hypothetical protein Ga0609869_001560 [Rhodovulum iodosum]|uniref:Hedgehog/Intein (Hint) domain-containing protein n=1 Tax=Rhodovulum iodosum TaxID=68291 RepID=A0ABV3XSA9_9RHOB|nr:Hint domain-containing protein [Rhodovulum robiginosum]RSK30533.1 Hint domain-containing protein [Rhodovulum robiginosum]